MHCNPKSAVIHHLGYLLPAAAVVVAAVPVDARTPARMHHLGSQFPRNNLPQELDFQQPNDEAGDDHRCSDLGTAGSNGKVHR